MPSRRFCSTACHVAHRTAETFAANEARRAAQPLVPCGWCTTPFRPKRLGHRFCSADCYNRGTDRLSNSRRRGLPEVSIIVRREIYERDGWRCHICRGRIKRRLRHPDLRSASLDHLIPLADGGTHDASNLASAHLGCNQARGRGGDVQLRAIA